MPGKSDKKIYKNAQDAWMDMDNNLLQRLEETMLHARKLSTVRLIRFFCWWLEQLVELPIAPGLIDEMFDALIYSTKNDSIPTGIYAVLMKTRRDTLLRVLQEEDLDDDETNRLIEVEGALNTHLGAIVRWIYPHHDY